MKLFPLLFIVGPTCVGKTELAVRAAEFARKRGVELPLLNCDSVQVFAEIEIGAAKPSAEQLIRAPHRLLSFVPADTSYAAGDYRRDALNEIEKARTLGCAVVVGGSGFYAQALERGMPDVPRSNPVTKAALEKRADVQGISALHAELAARDPERAARIKPEDRYRVVRALEVLQAQPLTLTELDRQHALIEPPPFEVRKIGLRRDRDRLRKAVTERVDSMLARGLVAETEALRARGLRDWAPLNSVGYREAQAHLDGKLAAAELREAIVTSTMQLAKRQMTWFRRDPKIEWHDADNEFAAAESSVREWLEPRAPFA